VFGVDSLDGMARHRHCRSPRGRSVDELSSWLVRSLFTVRLQAFAAELRKLEVLQAPASRPLTFAAGNSARVKLISYPLSTLVFER